MQRCSERAFAMCPYRHECGTIHEATFTDDSECAEFNRKVDSMPMTNADRIRAMSDEELAKMIAFLIEKDECFREDIDDCYKCPLCSFCSNCKPGGELEWLKQPVEVE